MMPCFKALNQHEKSQDFSSNGVMCSKKQANSLQQLFFLCFGAGRSLIQSSNTVLSPCALRSRSVSPLTLMCALSSLSSTSREFSRPNSLIDCWSSSRTCQVPDNKVPVTVTKQQTQRTTPTTHHFATATLFSAGLFRPQSLSAVCGIRNVTFPDLTDPSIVKLVLSL